MIEPSQPDSAATAMWQQSDAELAAAMAADEETIRQIQARQLARLAQMHQRGSLPAYGYRSLDTLQVDLLRISRAEAAKRTARALALHPHTDGGATEVPALAPATADAAATGAIGVEHVDVIVKTLDALPAEIPPVERAEYEQTLVRQAKTSDPQAVAKTGRYLRALVEQDYGRPSEQEQAVPQRELRLGWLKDGRLGITGTLDTETGVLLHTLLSPLTKPRPAHDGTPDPRTAAQRTADGLADLLEITQRAVDRPSEGGERPTIVVTLNYDALSARVAQAYPDITTDTPGGFATLNGEPISPEQARRLACDAKIQPTVLDSNGVLLDLGRTQRLASPHQRRALEIRDQHCVKCGRSAKWCHAHHIIHWLDGGATNLDNLCLLCSECHRLVHHADWQIRMVNHKPQAIPPAWIRTRQ